MSFDNMVKRESTMRDQLKEWRERWDLTQDQMAAAARDRGLRWSRSTVASIEIGRRELSLAEFVALRNAPVSIDELSDFFSHAATLRGIAGEAAEHLEAEIQAAKKLRVKTEVVVETAQRLWGKTLTEERDHRVKGLGIGNLVETADDVRSKMAARGEPMNKAGLNLHRMVQAHRGHCTRVLLAELADALKKGRKKR